MYSPSLWYVTMIDESYYMKVPHSQLSVHWCIISDQEVYNLIMYKRRNVINNIRKKRQRIKSGLYIWQNFDPGKNLI